MIVGLILHKQFCSLKIPQILSSHLTFNFLSSLRVPIKPLLFLKISQFAPPTDPSPKKNEFFLFIYLFLRHEQRIIAMLDSFRSSSAY